MSWFDVDRVFATFRAWSGMENPMLEKVSDWRICAAEGRLSGSKFKHFFTWDVPAKIERKHQEEKRA